jgi:hypothetical protein
MQSPSIGADILCGATMFHIAQRKTVSGHEENCLLHCGNVLYLTYHERARSLTSFASIQASTKPLACQ